MLGKISGFFWRIAGWPSFIGGLVIYLFFGVYLMPNGIKKFEEVSGKKVEVLDLQLSYSPKRARAIIGEYGDAGRAFAAKFEMIADSVYPLAYTFLLITTIAWIFKALARYGIVFSYIHLVPVLGMLADYCENAGIITMFKNYPDFPDRVAGISSFFTSLKWSFLGLELIIIMIGLGLLCYQRFGKRTEKIKLAD